MDVRLSPLISAASFRGYRRRIRSGARRDSTAVGCFHRASLIHFLPIIQAPNSSPVELARPVHKVDVLWDEFALTLAERTLKLAAGLSPRRTGFLLNAEARVSRAVRTIDRH